MKIPVSVDPVMDRAHYSIQNCMIGVNSLVYSDIHQSRLMRYSGSDHSAIGARMHEERLTDLGVWARGWRHRGGKGAIGSSDDFSHVDSPFVRCVKEHGYER